MTSCTREASGLERAEEGGPEGAILGVAHREAEDLAAVSPHTPVATTTAWEITRRLTRALQ